MQEDNGGEWEKVKTKSKAGRGFRATPVAKGPTSPNSSGGRRRGAAQNSSSSNGGASLSGFNNSLHEAVGRGRERDSKTDPTQRWRTDSDSWSGSSTLSSTMQEEDRSKKFPHENGFVAEISEGGVLVSGPGGFDGINGIASSKGFSHANGSSAEADLRVEIRLIEDDSNESNGFSINTVGGANSNARPGFVSYSAALKSGMLASAAAAENGFGENIGSAPAELAVPPTSNSGNRTSTNSYSGAAASATSVSPSSLPRTLKGDLAGDTVDGPSQKGGLNKVRPTGEGLISNNAKAGPALGVEIGKQEIKADALTNGDGNGKRPERAQPWGKPLTVRSSLPEVGSLQTGAAAGDKAKASAKTSGDSSAPPKKLAKDVLKTVVSEGEIGDTTVGNSRQGHSEAKDNAVKPAEPVRKNPWQGNDGAVLRLLHDPDPAVNSSSVNGATPTQAVESEVPKKQEKDQTPPPQSQDIAAPSPVEKGDADGRPTQLPRHLPNSSGALLPHGSHSKALPLDGPVFQPARVVHESRRQQFDNQKHEKHQEERSHFRKGHSQEHLQHPSSMVPHTQAHQLGQGLMPLHGPTPSPPGMQQHHHHPLLSPSPQPYRDRPRSRASNGNADNVPGLAYRPISRNMLDADVALQSPLVPGSWGLQSPVLLMQPVISPVTGNFTFPSPSPQMLVNAETLHAEILEFAKAASPSAETRSHAEKAVECVRDSVKELWPDADVEVSCCILL